MKKIISLTIILAVAVTAAAPAAVRSNNMDYIPDELIVKFRPEIADRLREQVELDTSTNQVDLSPGPGDIKLKYRAKEIQPLFKNFRRNQKLVQHLHYKDKALLNKKEKRVLGRLSRATKTTAPQQLDRIYKVKIDVESGQKIRNVLKAYRDDPDVEYAELNYIVSICNTPNDPLYPIQWPLNNTGQMYPESGRYNSPPGTPDADIDAPEAWGINTGASEIVVAVVDTGVDYNHRDLMDNMWVNQAELNGTTGIDDDGNGYIDDIYGYDFINGDADPKDDNGHGTHCSGIIAAEGDNGADISGVCWDARIMALKFLGSGGSGSTSDALIAFYYAVENGADVVSNSWGGGGFSQAMQDAINYARSQGVIMVAAAGNEGDNNIFYPAYYDRMFSVAATNSNDEKPRFSTYGSWVDIAAPGVDVLSLRASGTSMGTIYDAYTTIASGTSMACPHVVGACSLILSVYPEIGLDELETCLKNSVDSIDPDICASGRLNLHEALLQVVSPAGRVYFKHDAYSCSDIAQIRLLDFDLAGDSNQQVIISAETGDFEIVTLAEQPPYVGIFEGPITLDSNVSTIGDNILQISHDQIITVTYDDADDGTGNPAVVTDTAVTDCVPPVIFDVHIGFPGRQPKITFKTNEPTTGRVLCGLDCSEPYIIDVADMTLSTSHAIELTTVVPDTHYFFVIEANDLAGNTTTKKKHGHCFEFTTTGVGEIRVPSQCWTIQQAIDNSWDGGTVLVEDGIYTGDGNRDIDFKARAVTVISENGPESCIIDCNGTETEPHRGFNFHSGEDNNSVLSGFTVTNGYIPGSWYVGIAGAILCENDSNPTIDNCIFTQNTAGWDGGAICILSCSPRISNCTFAENTAVGNDGGAVNNESGSPVITNCTFTANTAYDWGGAIRNIEKGWPVIADCVFTANVSDDGGAVFYYYYNNSVITNCTFTENSADYGDSIHSYLMNHIQVENSIILGGPDHIWQNDTYAIDITYSNVSGGWSGDGNIDVDPLFVDPGHWDAGHFVNGDYNLQPMSHCINAGDPTYIPEPNETDLDGKPRVIGGRIDMGAYEFDSRPVANAGPDQLFYTWLDSAVDVNLDGSASYDDDTNDLDYYWSWVINGNHYEANVVTPMVELPVGEHEIELVVYDGIDFSEPDYCTINVVGPLPASLRIQPRFINKHGRGGTVLAVFSMPWTVEPQDIADEPLILYPGDIESQWEFVYETKARGRGRWFRRTMVIGCFSKQDLLRQFTQDSCEVTITGRLETGQYFYGTRTIWIMNHPWWKYWKHWKH